MGKKPGPKPIDVADKDVERWEGLREKGWHDIQTFHATQTTHYETLDRLAWLAGTSPTADVLTVAIQQCRDHRCTWREISEAAGYGTSTQAIRRLKKRHGFER